MLISKRRGKSEHENCLQTSEGLSHRPEVRPFCIDQEFGTRTKAYFLLIRNANSRWSILLGGDSDLSTTGGAEQRSAIRTAWYSGQR